MKILIPLYFALFTSFAFGQLPYLVNDLEPGSGNISIELYNSNFKGGYVNGGYVLATGNIATGEELFFIKDKKMILLKEISQGSSGSSLSNFMNIGQKLYFQSSNNIWSTNGTTEGTKLEVSSINGEIVQGGDNQLFFAKNDSVFSINNTYIISGFPFESNVFFRTDYYSNNESNVTPYKNGIVYVKSNNAKTTAFFIDSEGFKELGSFANSEDFKVVLTAAFKGGFVFSQKNSGGTIQKTFSFTESNAQFVQIKTKVPKYAVNINKESCFLIDEFKVELFNENNPKGKVIENNAAEFYSSFEFSILDKNILYHNKDFNSYYTINKSDGISSKEILKTQNKYISNIITKGNFGFLASGISNGLKPYLYVYKNNEEKEEIIYEFDKYSSTQRKSVYPICFLDKTLYFLYSLETQYGQEVFALDFPDLISSSSNNNIISCKLDQTGPNSFKLAGDSLNEKYYYVSIIDLSGREISSFKILPDYEFEVKRHSGLFIIRIEGLKEVFSKKVYISN